MAKPFHLAWFLQGSSAQAWGEEWTGHIGANWMVPELFVDLGRTLERACFDYVLIEDSSYIGESYAGSTAIYLENAIAVPRQDPAIIAAFMTQQTSRIGIVPTFGTYSHHPYLLARIIASLDQVSRGRIGWNVVTGSSDFAAMNYGLPGLPEHDTRYDMADEYIAAVKALWGSWEPGAIVDDNQRGVFIDPAKVHHINFEGEFYKTRGPLNSGPCPQGQPVIAQAGGSPRGREFAARHGDTIVAHAKGVGGMKAYRDDVRRHMAAFDRNPDNCKVLFMIAPILGETPELALEHKRRRAAHAAAQIKQRLAFFGKLISVDFSGFDLDKPICDIEITTNGHQLNLEQFKRIAGARTLRETMAEYNATSLSVELVGTPDTVAAKMGEVMEEVGGDGYLFSLSNVSRRALAEIEDGLVPALQARGLARKVYSFAQFRDNLLEF
jgi:FMN-dependent oxidoreductase (nitrilotriacetate monooxygenase family)